MATASRTMASAISLEYKTDDVQKKNHPGLSSNHKVSSEILLASLKTNNPRPTINMIPYL